MLNKMMNKDVKQGDFAMKKIVSNSRLFLAACIFLVCFAASPEMLNAQSKKKTPDKRQKTVTIKLASSLPRNSSWGKDLDRVAAEWIKITNGEVTLQIMHSYPGSEGKYLELLNQDSIQAVILTSVGLNSIAPEVMSLSMPLLIGNDDEMDAVLTEVRPTLNKLIEQKGYVNLVWVKAGWIKIFARNPVFMPNDLRRLKLGTSPDEPELMDAFKSMGYNMVPVAIPDVPQKFSNGTIDAVYQSPIFASATQFYHIAKNMSTINVAPFMGGVILSKQAWSRIPEKYRSQLMESAQKAGLEIENSFHQSEADAIAAMRQDGLSLNELSAAQEAEWFQDVQRYYPDLVNRGVFNKEMYERIVGILQNYRKSR
jgi:TRAP-type C4-dicarboxylate transport system substrate-binding protein